MKIHFLFSVSTVSLGFSYPINYPLRYLMIITLIFLFIKDTSDLREECIYNIYEYCLLKCLVYLLDFILNKRHPNKFKGKSIYKVPVTLISRQCIIL